MKFMCLVYIDETSFAGMSEADNIKLTDETIVADHDLRRRGHLILSQPLQDPGTGVSIRIREGKTLRTDGPFVESKEWLGGFYLIEARDLEEAVAIANEDPMARIGRIEIRPTLEQTHSETGQARPELDA